MTSQDQNLQDNQIENSQVQLVQAGQNAVSFQNSHDNHVTINKALLQFGRSAAPTVDWDWAKRLLKDKQLPEIRKRLADTLGRERALMSVSFKEEMGWVGRSPLEAIRVLQKEDKAEDTLDPHQLLIATFGRDDIVGKLLILGTPGSGKTTALLGLAEQLVCGALAQPQTVIPVLFELSTWRRDTQSIHDWLIEQLYEQHGGNRKAKRYEHWLDQQVLLPLMDGLDELGLEWQQKCTQKLKEFARQYPHLVVCCRGKEFDQAGIKLDTLRGAVRLEPLPDSQIQTFLEQQQSPLWSVIQQNSQFQKLLEPTAEGDPGLLRIPLFVTLVVWAYDPQHPFQTKAELLDQYIARQLSRDVRDNCRDGLKKKDWAYKTVDQEPDRQRTQQTLAWLARQLQQTNTVELLIERIQPRWLETTWSRKRYRLSVGLIFGLLGGLIFGLLGGLSGEITIGLLGGLMVALMVDLDDIQPVEDFKISMSPSVQREIFSRLRWWLIAGLSIGLLGGLSMGQLFGLSVGSILGLSMGFVLLAFGLIVALVGGLKQDLKLRSRPNQGIWNSLKIFLWTTALSSLSLIALQFLLFGITDFSSTVAQGITEGESSGAILRSLGQAFFQYLRLGIVIGLPFGLAVGGLPSIKYGCLRWVLWQSGVAPWNLKQFLNYCVERRLLQRVGGTYRFIHRELLDHFAQRPPSSG